MTPPGLEASNRLSLWALVGFALVVRLLLLWVRGDYIVYDEGYYLLLARSLRAGDGFTLNGLPHVALSPLQPLVVAALSFTGLPDLWASRLLAAVCGALLVLPVGSLAGRCFGERGARTAGLFVALHPALLTFVPFFPGESWNLYFGSEPLYLLLATSAVAAGAKAAVEDSWRWWIATGVLGALAWLTRLEGIVLSAALGLALLGALAYQRRLALWPRAVAAAVAGALVAAPYLVFLHGALGRWALSGRVQAAAPASAPVAVPQPDDSSGGSDAVNDFVWGGDSEALWRTLYALDASGTRMASQYWGVAPRDLAPPRDSSPPRAVAPAPARPDTAAPPSRPRQSGAATLVRAVLVVAPAWFLLLGCWGFARVRPAADLGLWLAPMVVATLLPAVLAYAEPRALLMLVPATCIGAAGAAEFFRDLLDRRLERSRGALIPASIALALALPTLRDAVRAWDQQTPLQQVSSARRVVGQYLAEHVAHEVRVVSWHPAIALWARRDWRVLPYEPLDRILPYARAQHAEVLVFSRFEPSPFTDPPRAFTAILLDSASMTTGREVRLEPVESTPVLFVGRLREP